jgi:hypothetical protein
MNRHLIKKPWIALLLVCMCSAGIGQGATRFVGFVSDAMCGAMHLHNSRSAASRCANDCIAKHVCPACTSVSACVPRTDCIIKCVRLMNSRYVLVSQGKIYQLTPQASFAQFAGQTVQVIGTLANNTITAHSVSAFRSGGRLNKARPLKGP